MKDLTNGQHIIDNWFDIQYAIEDEELEPLEMPETVKQFLVEKITEAEGLGDSKKEKTLNG